MRTGRDRAAGLWRAGWTVSRRYAPRSQLAAVGVIVGLFAAVTLLRWFVGDARQATALLYVVPIALGAVRFGRRGGYLVAGTGIAAFTVLEVARPGEDVAVLGWVGPLLAMALMGVLVGRLSESQARHDAAYRLQAERLEWLSDARSAAIEASDSIVQQVAAVRWMLEIGQSQEALAALSDIVAEGIANVSRSRSACLPEADPVPSGQACGEMS